jgi:predicted nuclease of predicted toxin-antitoxin system
MNFLVDVNASGVVSSWLVERGHDVAQVKSIDPAMKDEEVLAWAIREKRIIVTTDQDFEEMIWRERKQHTGLLRLENLPRLARIELLEYVFAHYEKELAAGSILIATSRKIRIRSVSAM